MLDTVVQELAMDPDKRWIQVFLFSSAGLGGPSQCNERLKRRFFCAGGESRMRLRRSWSMAWYNKAK